MYGKGHRVNLDLLLNLLNFFQNNEILQMICKYNVNLFIRSLRHSSPALSFIIVDIVLKDHSMICMINCHGNK